MHSIQVLLISAVGMTVLFVGFMFMKDRVIFNYFEQALFVRVIYFFVALFNLAWGVIILSVIVHQTANV
jgi:hypothetical protein